MPATLSILRTHLLVPKSPNLSFFSLNRSRHHPRLLSTTASHNHPSSSSSSSSSSRSLPFQTGPSPPRLPKEEQELFETLQRQSTGAFSTPRESPKINQSPDSVSTDRAEAEDVTSQRADKVASSSSLEQQPPKNQSNQESSSLNPSIPARGKGEELHPAVRRGAPPEFQGDVNPKTGEVGGPKNEPLRWGSGGEWSYNGRTTDF